MVLEIEIFEGVISHSLEFGGPFSLLVLVSMHVMSIIFKWPTFLIVSLWLPLLNGFFASLDQVFTKVSNSAVIYSFRVLSLPIPQVKVGEGLLKLKVFEVGMNNLKSHLPDVVFICPGCLLFDLFVHLEIAYFLRHWPALNQAPC